MNYRWKRHISNTLLYAIIITAIMGIIRQKRDILRGKENDG
jgi:hypothetical protein